MQKNPKKSGALPVFSPAFYLLISALVCFHTYMGRAQYNPRCLTPQYDSLLKIKYPSLLADRQQLNQKISQYQRIKQGAVNLRENEETIVIPVVVHVVHNTASGAIGGSTNGNISDDQILSQIEVLNEDYRRKEDTNGFNQDPNGADVNIEFRLASLDPNGKPTNGITRTYHIQKDGFDVNSDNEKLKAIVYWPSNRYLNIWVTSLKNRYLGYAQFPVVNESILPGLPDLGELAKTDGVVINHVNFGRNIGTVGSEVYGEGRTTSHEIGHWLGLLHTFGDSYCGEDYCKDTPPAYDANETVECIELFSTCEGATTRNMVENYMDYSPDRCMNIFTKDQKARIRSVMEVSSSRAELVRRAKETFQSGLIAVKLFPNPAGKSGIVHMDVNYHQLPDITIQIFSSTGKIIHRIPYKLASSQLELDVRSLPNGLYIVHVSSSKETRTARLLVSN